MLHILLFYSWLLDNYLRSDLSYIKQPLRFILHPVNFIRNIILCIISPIFIPQYVLELNTNIELNTLLYKFRVKTGL
jgi:hypothetical protein